MELTSQFFDGCYYRASDFASAQRSIIKTGVNTDPNSLKVTESSNMNIIVTAGCGIIEGRTFQLESNYTLSIDRADGSNNRIDTVIIRQNLTVGAEKFEMLVIKGAYGIEATATPPVRDGIFYDLVLAEILVAAGVTSISQTDITDKRTDSTVCGLMSNAGTSIDITDFMAQQVTIFNNWCHHLATELNSNQALNLQTQIDSLCNFKDTLHVGNVNLFKNSGFNGTTGWVTYGTPTVAVNDGVISVTVTDEGIQWICPSDISMFKHGATYTIQAWLKADMPIKMRIGAAWGNKVVDVTTEWALYTYTYTAATYVFDRTTYTTNGDNYIKPVFGTNAPYNNTTFYVKQPKIVEGNHITASWEPSPYDIPQCIQAGKITTDNTGKATVTFPRAFSSAPAVYATSHYSNTGTVFGVQVLSVSATGCVLYNSTWGSSYSNAGQPVAPIQWLAIGT